MPPARDRTGANTALHRQSHDGLTFLQRRSPSGAWSACSSRLAVHGRAGDRAGAVGHVLASPVVAALSARASALRSARSSRPTTRSLVSGKRCP